MLSVPAIVISLRTTPIMTRMAPWTKGKKNSTSSYKLSEKLYLFIRPKVYEAPMYATKSIIFTKIKVAGPADLI